MPLHAVPLRRVMRVLETWARARAGPCLDAGAGPSPCPCDVLGGSSYQMKAVATYSTTVAAAAIGNAIEDAIVTTDISTTAACSTTSTTTRTAAGGVIATNTTTAATATAATATTTTTTTAAAAGGGGGACFESVYCLQIAHEGGLAPLGDDQQCDSSAVSTVCVCV